MPDPLHLIIALGPLATYFVVLGLIHASGRPLVVSGGRDSAALALAIAGLVIVGPMELFLIEEAAVRYGQLVWGMMLVAYTLAALLIILLQRPRIVVYNIRLDILRPVLADLAPKLDTDVRWAGESLVLPALGVQLHLESSSFGQNVQLVSSGPDQNIPGWKRLEHSLAAALAKTRHNSPQLAAFHTLIGLALACIVTYFLTNHPAQVLHALNDMLRR